MTKKIVAVLALSLVSTGAFASQAKNLVSGGGDGGNILGTSGMNGSFYTNDEYNMFWNPAFIAGSKGWAVVENGSNSGTSAGFVTDMSGMNLGLFFNRPVDVGAGSQAVDIVLGGDMGMKWGVGLTQTMSQVGSNQLQTTRLKAGLVSGDLEPFAQFDIKNTNTTDTTKDDSNMTIGARYHYGEWAPYVAYNGFKLAGATETTKTYGLGLGRMTKMGDVNMGYSISYWRVDNVGGSVPLNLNVSTDATSWLTVRGGFSHTLRASPGAGSATATTLGASAHVGKADLDFTIGKHAAGAVILTDASDDNSFGIDGAFFANAGLVYHW